jgi:nascent polypeptide-associated complex subunit alpha
MFPGMDPRAVKMAMKQMGITQEEIDASEVVIRTKDKEIVISNPAVTKIKMRGDESFQVSGSVSIRTISTKPEITEEDIQTVMEQANVDKEAAEKAINDVNGDIAEAILKLKLN